MFRVRRGTSFALGTSLASALAAQEEYHPKHNPDAQRYECPACGEESVVIVEEGIGICTVWECREPCMLDSCDRCGSIKMSGQVYCGDCSSYLQDQFEKED